MRSKLPFLFSLVLVALSFGGGMLFGQAVGLPPAEADAMARLNSSPRHGEWVTVDAGMGDKVDAWVVYPERADKAAVVIVIHEIFGLTDWARAVADQVAAEGFIAVAPDFLSGKAPGGKGSSAVTADQARGLIGALKAEEILRRLDAVASYATALPAARKEFGVVGYCWGGGISFSYATHQPDLDAAVVYYGTSPATEALRSVQAPVLGLYGGADARVNATIPAAEAELKRLQKRFEYEAFDGAGHAFLRQQTGANGANLEATKKAWPRMVAFLKETLESRMSLDSAPVVPAALSVDDCCPEEMTTSVAEVAEATEAHLHHNH